jgi:hypothetical protein
MEGENMFGIDDIILLILFGATGATVKWLGSGNDEPREDDYHLDNYHVDDYLVGHHYVPPRHERTQTSGTGLRNYRFDRQTGQLTFDDEE